ncbi:MAG: hypothetical protein C5B54_08310 [Acidobacteria bacterium]|nr:MAG: hypothetical protein C5B54_08310 [Acidobacteriota bacterium]
MPDWKQQIHAKLVNLKLEPTKESQVVEELSQHLDDLYAELQSRGFSSEDAYSSALQELNQEELSKAIGNAFPQAERNVVYSQDKPAFTNLAQDIRYGFRMLRRNFAFTALAVLALALGIGVDTTIVNIVYAVLLRPLPFKNASDLVVIQSYYLQQHEEPWGAAPADYWDWREQNQVFDEVAMLRGASISWKDSDHPQLINGALVTANYFQTLGVSALLGRTFLPQDESDDTAVAVVSQHFWKQRFGADSEIIGKVFDFDGRPTIVIGVMPSSFRFPRSAEIYLPVKRHSSEMIRRANPYFLAIGDLKSNVSIQNAQSAMKTIAARLAMQYPDTNKDRSVVLISFRNWLVKEVQPALWMLFGAAAFVLLIACANVAALILARATTRQKEIAIRISLGATRRNIVQQVLIESLLLAIAGGIAGLVLAYWSLDAIVAGLGNLQGFPVLGDIRTNSFFLLSGLLVSLLACVLFAFFPGRTFTRRQMFDALRETQSISDRHENRILRRLVMTQISITLVLLAGAGLLLQSFFNLQKVSLGYDPGNLLTMSLSGLSPKYKDEMDRARFYQNVIDTVRRLPGVSDVAITSGLPFGFLSFPFKIEGRPDSKIDTSARFSSISPGYFHAMKSPLLIGREFNNDDQAGKPLVAIINDAMRRHYFASENPIGRHILINYLGTWKQLEIIGVASDIKQEELGALTDPEIFAPFMQVPWLGAVLLIRSPKADSQTFTDAVQRSVWQIDGDQPVSKSQTMMTILSDSINQPRLYTVLLTIFGSVALMLAAIGIYGLMAQAVQRRMHEFGIRVALGARRTDLFRLVFHDVLRITIFGLVTGFVVAILIARSFERLLFGIKPIDVPTFLVAVLIVIGVALCACAIPAQKAADADPMSILRYE